MAISLQKGGNVSLSQVEPGIQRVIIGLGWDQGAAEGPVFDLDSSAFLLRADGKVRGDGDFIFYNNLRSEDGSVEHSGDNLTGFGRFDDERLEVDLAHVPADVERIAVAVTIHEAETRRQDFGMVGHAFIRCLNADNEHEIARFDLSGDYSNETSLVFGELVRSGSDWRFRAIGQGYRGGLEPLARSYGVNA
ncbi:MAG: TerD family protein [Telluria sp.]